MQEGLFTVLSGICMFFVMPATPATCFFLTPDERKHVCRALTLDGIVSRNEDDDAFSWDQVRKTFMAPQVLILGVAGFFNGAYRCS